MERLAPHGPTVSEASPEAEICICGKGMREVGKTVHSRTIIRRYECDKCDWTTSTWNWVWNELNSRLLEASFDAHHAEQAWVEARDGMALALDAADAALEAYRKHQQETAIACLCASCYKSNVPWWRICCMGVMTKCEQYQEPVGKQNKKEENR